MTFGSVSTAFTVCSIPSLIWAASVIPDSQENKPPSMKFLEERVEKLEAELANKDGDTSRLLRAMEQRCNQSKVWKCHWHCIMSFL